MRRLGRHHSSDWLTAMVCEVRRVVARDRAGGLLTLRFGKQDLVTRSSRLSHYYSIVALGLVLLTGLAGQVSPGAGACSMESAPYSRPCTCAWRASKRSPRPLAIITADLWPRRVGGRAICGCEASSWRRDTSTVNLVFFYLVVVFQLDGRRHRPSVMIPRSTLQTS